MYMYDGGLNKVEEKTLPPLHSPMAEVVIADQLAREIHSSHVVVALYNTLRLLNDFMATICKSQSVLSRKLTMELSRMVLIIETARLSIHLIHHDPFCV